VTVVVLAGGGSAEPALLAEPPIGIAAVEPALGRSSIAVERVAAPFEGGAETWLLNLDVLLGNKQTRSLVLQRVVISYPGSGIETRTVPYSPRDPEATFAGLSSTLFPVPETRLFPFPVAKTVSVSFAFEGYRDPIVVTRPLGEWRNRVAGNAYRFPFDREDLPPGTYVSDDNTHVVGSGHRGAQGQQFAYDYGVFRWTGSAWTSVIEGSLPERRRRNSDFLIWGLAVRAMADGWVLRCEFSFPDQPPGVKVAGGGNSYRIVHANGEVALYAHLRAGSIPRRLCPKAGIDFAPNQVKVRAGEIVGRVGNTGQSTNPHLHIHLGTTGKTGEQGRPIHFKGIRVRDAGVDGTGSAPCSAANKPFALVTRAATGPWQLVDPLYRSGDGELAWHGLEDLCFQDVFDAAADSGYGLSWLTGFDIGGKTYLNAVSRKGAPQIVRFGLTGAAYQSALESAVAAGFRPTHLESYLRGGQARYAFVAEKKPRPAYRAYHGVPMSSHEDFVKQLAARGMAPVAVSVVSTGVPRVTALWEARNIGAWQLRSAVPLSQYQAWLAGEAKAGRHLVYLDAWRFKGTPVFSAIVSSRASKVYVARHGLTGAEYQAEYEKWTGKGLRTQAVTAYRVGAAVRYAALWR
jgi:hypothetical protein